MAIDTIMSWYTMPHCNHINRHYLLLYLWHYDIYSHCVPGWPSFSVPSRHHGATRNGVRKKGSMAMAEAKVKGQQHLQTMMISY